MVLTPAHLNRRQKHIIAFVLIYFSYLRCVALFKLRNCWEKNRKGMYLPLRYYEYEVVFGSYFV